MSEQKPRLAASSYLNSAPLIWSFVHGPQRHEVELVDAVPAGCADLLRKGLVDFALVPVIEYQRIPSAELIPYVCVASHREVKSVVLVSRLNNLKKIHSVALDESSRTSATLVKIIFKEFVGFEPAWVTASPNIVEMLRKNDAALIIGDPGMSFARKNLHVWDLATLWHECTGLGFVFAMWMKLSETQLSSPDFAGAAGYGLKHIEEIVSDFLPRIELPAEEIRSYLTQNIVFRMDQQLRQGMEQYFLLAAKYKLIEDFRALTFTDGKDLAQNAP